MGKLYPPYLEGKLPAFVAAENYIEIPFDLNLAVGDSDFKSIKPLIKTISGVEITGIDNASCITKNGQRFAYIDITNIKDKFVEDQFYKVQLAFISDVVGFYSTAGIIKNVKARPTLTINDFDDLSYKYSNPVHFIGKYDSKDKTDEKVCYYEFNIYDEYHNLYETSDRQIHNIEKNVNNYESQDEWTSSKKLQTGKNYSIEYKVITNNLLECSTEYTIVDTNFKKVDILLKLQATFDRENARTILSISDIKKQGVTEITGKFKIVRASSRDDYQAWTDLVDIVYAKKKVVKGQREVYRDYTVEQGIGYKYAIQRYNDNGIRSTITEPQEIFADFEHMYLFDGEKQLKLIYNPKVSSLKTTILESKTDTIGGKYPFFYRNGQVSYKELPISALITFNMDDQREFFDPKLANSILDSDYGAGNQSRRDKTPSSKTGLMSSTTALSAENFQIERDFKLKVADWLNNGKPKLFRSPAEGNYFVRLMNISLSPNESLSRMLHTFSATAYEAGAADYSSLLSSGLLKKAYIEDNTTTSELKSFSRHHGEITLDDVVLLEVFDWFDGMDKLKVLNKKNNTTIPSSYSSAATGYAKWENLPPSKLQVFDEKSDEMGFYRIVQSREYKQDSFDTIKYRRLVTTSETINNWADFKTVIERLGAYNIEYITIKEIQGPLTFKKGNSSEVIKDKGTFLIQDIITIEESESANFQGTIGYTKWEEK